MQCDQCGRKMNPPTPANGVEYPCGVPDVYLNGVLVATCPGCDNQALVIHAIEQLHQVLAQAVAARPGRLTPPEVRFLRKHLGWSREDFAHQVGVKPATVRAWESRPNAMPPAQERLLRVLATVLPPVESYEVDEGHVDVDVRALRAGLAAWAEDTDDPETPLGVAFSAAGWHVPSMVPPALLHPGVC